MGPRLRAGRHSLPRDRVEAIQRARLLGAMVEVAAAGGYQGASVSRVVARAGISRRTFYELFAGREECLIAALEQGITLIAAQMGEAYAREDTWREGVRIAVATGLACLDAEPELARACVVEALGAGPTILAWRARVGARAKSASAERATATADREVAPPLSELLGRLMALIVLPYLGPLAAGEELVRPPPELPDRPASSRRGRANGRVLEQLNTRLTCRTVRCLLFIGEHPDSSNREIAKGTEIADEGQVSRLLMRLAGLDLLAKTSSSPGKPNAWRLTPDGQQVLQAVQGS
ncbi:MAG TPA: TetR/AcrR family transcriptional regulator [Solirubrobacteraceae bacterium]|jgi:AcrR family transcriptional regulator